MPSPQTERRSLPELIETLRRVGLVDPVDPLDGAELLVGWESAVVRTADGWIHRFARVPRETYDREVVVLALVEGRLGVPTPRIERVDPTGLVMSYRTIVGASLDLDAVRAQTPDERSSLTRSWATALAAMHGLTAEIVGQVAVPTADHRGMAATIRPAIEQHDGPVREALTARQTDWDDQSRRGSGGAPGPAARRLPPG